MKIKGTSIKGTIAKLIKEKSGKKKKNNAFLSEWSKEPDLRSGVQMYAWVQTPQNAYKG